MGCPQNAYGTKPEEDRMCFSSPGGTGGTSTDSARIATWVTVRYPAETVGNATADDLTQLKSS
jgi:hypothetical protein